MTRLQPPRRQVWDEELCPKFHQYATGRYSTKRSDAGLFKKGRHQVPPEDLQVILRLWGLMEDAGTKLETVRLKVVATLDALGDEEAAAKDAATVRSRETLHDEELAWVARRSVLLKEIEDAEAEVDAAYEARWNALAQSYYDERNALAGPINREFDEFREKVRARTRPGGKGPLPNLGG